MCSHIRNRGHTEVRAALTQTQDLKWISCGHYCYLRTRILVWIPAWAFCWEIVCFHQATWKHACKVVILNCPWMEVTCLYITVSYSSWNPVTLSGHLMICLIATNIFTNRSAVSLFYRYCMSRPLSLLQWALRHLTNFMRWQNCTTSFSTETMSVNASWSWIHFMLCFIIKNHQSVKQITKHILDLG